MISPQGRIIASGVCRKQTYMCLLPYLGMISAAAVTEDSARVVRDNLLTYFRDPQMTSQDTGEAIDMINAR